MKQSRQGHNLDLAIIIALLFTVDGWLVVLKRLTDRVLANGISYQGTEERPVLTYSLVIVE